MKYLSLLLTTCLVFFLLPKNVSAAISLSVSELEKKDDYYVANVIVTGLSSSSGCFIQGMFTSTESSNYFGYTWSSKGEWLKYDGSPEKEFVLGNFIELKNDEPQNIIVKPDMEDSDYKGPGNYHFKVKRYTSSGTASTHFSNNISLILTEPTPTEIISPTPSPTPSITSTVTPTQTPTPTRTPTSTPTRTPTSSPTQTMTPTKLPSPTIKSITSSSSATLSAVLGESTDSASISSKLFGTSPTQVKEIRKNKPANFKTPFFVGLLIALSSGSLLYFRHRKD